MTKKLNAAVLSVALLLPTGTAFAKHRNQGAGSFLLGQIMAEAKEAGKPVSIYVEIFNPSLQLFQRLGFTPIQQEGFHLLLQCAG